MIFADVDVTDIGGAGRARTSPAKFIYKTMPEAPDDRGRRPLHSIRERPLRDHRDGQPADQGCRRSRST